MRVDFHVHSTFSDGTFTPAELCAEAERQGFRAWSITDHDNADFWTAVLKEPPPLRCGIELAVDPGEGLDQFHLLGLGIDPGTPELKAFLKRILEGRRSRNERILANFARLGIEIDPADIATYAHGDVLARPHFAKWLMDHGYVNSIAEAFDTYLMKDSPAATRCFEERYQPAQDEAIAVVHAAGGVAIMAHPRYWSFRWKDTGVDYELVKSRLPPLFEMGLDGIEARYQANTPEMNYRFEQMADQFRCLKSAGSDFHGTNKPTIPLGMDVPDRFIRPLLERLDIPS